MSEQLMVQPQQPEDTETKVTLTDGSLQGAAGKITVFEALANDLPAFSPNMSNQSSRQGNADYDDA